MKAATPERQPIEHTGLDGKDIDGQFAELAIGILTELPTPPDAYRDLAEGVRSALDTSARARARELAQKFTVAGLTLLAGAPIASSLMEGSASAATRPATPTITPNGHNSRPEAKTDRSYAGGVSTHLTNGLMISLRGITHEVNSLTGAGTAESDPLKKKASIGDKSGLAAESSAAAVTSYTVMPGDSLGKIAADHGTTVSQLAEINEISNVDLIKPGQELNLSGGVEVPAPTAQEEYTVVVGDTLTKIAARYHTTVSAIATANSISDPNLIIIGEELRIPETTGSLTSVTGQNEEYTVVAGDTLTKIADRYHTTVSEIATANGISDPNLILTGEKLRIPETATPTLISTPVPASIPAAHKATTSPVPQPNIGIAPETTHHIDPSRPNHGSTPAPAPKAVSPAILEQNTNPFIALPAILRANGLNNVEIAAFLGNFWDESGEQPLRLQNTGWNVETPAGDIPSDELNNPYEGWGFYQASSPETLISIAKAHGLDPNKYMTQIQVLMWNLQARDMFDSPGSKATYLQNIKAGGSVAADTEIFMSHFERCGDPAGTIGVRTNAAIAIYNFLEYGTPLPASMPVAQMPAMSMPSAPTPAEHHHHRSHSRPRPPAKTQPATPPAAHAPWGPNNFEPNSDVKETKVMTYLAQAAINNADAMVKVDIQEGKPTYGWCLEGVDTTLAEVGLPMPHYNAAADTLSYFQADKAQYRQVYLNPEDAATQQAGMITVFPANSLYPYGHISISAGGWDGVQYDPNGTPTNGDVSDHVQFSINNWEGTPSYFVPTVNTLPGMPANQSTVPPSTALGQIISVSPVAREHKSVTVRHRSFEAARRPKRDVFEPFNQPRSPGILPPIDWDQIL